MSLISQRSLGIPTDSFIIPWIPSKWTGDGLRTILSFLCPTFLFLGSSIFVYELLGWPTAPMLPKGLQGILSIVKYFYFSGAGLTFTWYLYDVFIYNPHHRRTSDRPPSSRLPRQSDPPSGQVDSPTAGRGRSQPDWPMPELEAGHPLVEGLKDLRELALAESYRRPLRERNETGRMALREYAECRYESDKQRRRNLIRKLLTAPR